MARNAKVRRRMDRLPVDRALRKFLTPEVIGSIYSELPGWKTRNKNWEMASLIYTAIWISLLPGGDSLEVRFQEAREIARRMRPKRKAPGKTHTGFVEALKRISESALQVFRDSLREQIRSQLKAPPGVWIPVAVDGSKVAVSRTKANEMGFWDGEDDVTPNAFLTAMWELSTGLLYDWRIGPGKSSERQHVQEMVKAHSGTPFLVVGDAGFGGYDFLTHLDQEAKVSFLVRVASNTTLISEHGEILDNKQGQIVYLWPKNRKKKDPLRLRLISFRAKGHKERICLLTNVLDPQRLSLKGAKMCYQQRWGVEVEVFRNLKQTLRKTKLHSRTYATAIRELEFALIALMLIQGFGALCHGVRSMPSDKPLAYSCSSISQLLQEYGRALRFNHRKRNFLRTLREHCVRDQYTRRRPKAARRPISKKTTKAPKPPKLRTPNRWEKPRIELLERKIARKSLAA